jgi:GNAT superfamily N-acetyltransferase
MSWRRIPVEPDIVSLAQRPELAGKLYDDFEGAWPRFMRYDAADTVFDTLVEQAYSELTLIAFDPATGEPVAKAYSLPFTWPGDPDDGLPPSGYDAVLLGAANDRLNGRRGNLLSLVEITVRPSAQGAGLAGTMLGAVRRMAAEQGYPSLVLPVRPTRAHEYPDMPVAEYATWVRGDGLPFDPWLRLHVRAGGRIVGVATHSMVIIGTLAEWRDWTGLPFDTDGPVRVPGALAPVRCDLAAGVGVYVEPNVWVHHTFG